MMGRSRIHHGARGWRCNWRLPFVAALVLVGLAGCGVEQQSDLVQPNSASVNLNITMPANVAAAPRPTHRLVAMVQRWLFSANAWAATVNEIAALVVHVTGPGIPSPIPSPRVPVNGAVGGETIPVTLDVPVGTDRVFTVSALNAANRPIFRGQSEPVTLVAGQAATANVRLTDTTIRISTTTLPDGTEDRSYTATLRAERASGAVTWIITDGRIPPGIELNVSTGGMTGTPTVTGTYSLTIRATDTAGLFDEQRVSVRVNPAPIPPRITTTTLPEGTAGSSYSTTLTATGGTGTPTWSVVSGTLPPGLRLNEATGAITGTPTTEGTSNFTVRATDTIPLTGEKALSIQINPVPKPPTITTTTLPDGTEQVKYNAQVTAAGGTGAVTWSVVAGGLPDGLKLNDSTGAITGTPTKNGTFGFTIRATDTIPLINEKALVITIKDAPKPPVITSTTLPDGKVGDAYSAQLTATSTNGAVRWSVIPAGDPAPGLIVNGATGAITGTPTTKGTFEFTVRATDSVGLTDEHLLFIQISEKPTPPVITTTSVEGGTVGNGYKAEFHATGSLGITWSIAGGTLPPGLEFENRAILGILQIGEITGTPTTAGTYTFTVRVTNTLSGLSDSRDFSITVVNPLTITTNELPDGFTSLLYNFKLVASGGTPAYTWSLTQIRVFTGSGFTFITPPMPDGLTLIQDGTITGTPTRSGTFTLSYEVKDTGGATTNKRLTLRINACCID